MSTAILLATPLSPASRRPKTYTGYHLPVRRLALLAPMHRPHEGCGLAGHQEVRKEGQGGGALKKVLNASNLLPFP